MSDLNYFTQDHFELLKEWSGKTKENTEEADLAYESLTKAYKLTRLWAKNLQGKTFPNGFIKIRMAVTNPRNHFASYNLARIYPEKDSSKELAITVGISTNNFFCKIDTVRQGPKEISNKYEELRDAKDSHLVSELPIVEGLSLSMDELVNWSSREYEKMNPSYNDLIKLLDIEVATSVRTHD